MSLCNGMMKYVKLFKITDQNLSTVIYYTFGTIAIQNKLIDLLYILLESIKNMFIAEK